MRQNKSFAVLIFVVILGIGAALAYARYRVAGSFEAGVIGVCAFVLAIVVSSAIQVADQWDRAVILRLGHFHALRGPGLFFIIPVLDAIPFPSLRRLHTLQGYPGRERNPKSRSYKYGRAG